MSFTEKLITVEFDLASGEFQGGGNRATVSGLRVSCHLANVGGADQSQAEISIYGMPLSLMQQLTNVGAQYNKSYLNGITVLAGDAENGLQLVFIGTIFTAFIDAQGPPDVCFRVFASPGSYQRVAAAQPLSVRGPMDVASAMHQLAGLMDLDFENNGVKVKLASRYYFGSAWEQAGAIAEAAGIVWMIDRKTLIISPPGVPRQGDPVPISPANGLVGYPIFNQSQLIVTALYDATVKFQGMVKITSSLQGACGDWIVGAMEIDLESVTPDGRWFMTLHCYTQGQTPS